MSIRIRQLCRHSDTTFRYRPQGNFPLDMVASDLGTLLIAILVLPLVVSDYGARLVQWFLASCLSLFHSDAVWCDSFEWKDIRDGPLHSCGPTCRLQGEAGPTDATKRCWQRVLAKTYNISWGHQRVVAVRRPMSLGMDRRRFLQIDSKTLLTALLVNATSSFGDVARYDPLFIAIGDSTLQLRCQKNLLIGHLNNSQSRDFLLTKNECARILQGHPPYYRERVQTYRGDYFPYPEMANGGIRRGGWVVAVALSPTLPTAAYIVQQHSDGRGFDSTCCRVRDVVEQVIKRGFLESLPIKSACRSLETMCDVKSGSG